MRQLIALSVATLSLLGVQDVRSQSQGTSIDANLEEPSGWLRFEVAVFVDSSEATLNSETWPIAPLLNYDDNSRWLTEFDETSGLLDEYPTAELVVHPNGSITVVEPEPVVTSVENAEPSLEDSAIDDSELVTIEMDDVAAIRGEFDPDPSGIQNRPLTSLSILQEVLESNDLSAPNETADPETVSPEAAYFDMAAPATSDAVPMELLSTPLPNSPVAMDQLMTSEADDAMASASNDMASGNDLTLASGEGSATDFGEDPSALGQTDTELFDANSPSIDESSSDEIFELPGFRMGGSLEDDLQSPLSIGWTRSPRSRIKPMVLTATTTAVLLKPSLPYLRPSKNYRWRCSSKVSSHLKKHHLKRRHFLPPGYSQTTPSHRRSSWTHG